MKRIITLFSCICLSYVSIAQNDNNTFSKKFTRLNLGFHGIETTLELPIFNAIVWETSFGIGMGSEAYNNKVNYTLAVKTPIPYLTTEVKFLYNQKKRVNKGRSWLNNSGNYIGLQTKYSFGNNRYSEFSNTLLSEAHWGIQRPLGSKFIFDMHLGLGYLSDFRYKTGSVSPTFGLRFGYILF